MLARLNQKALAGRTECISKRNSPIKVRTAENINLVFNGSCFGKRSPLFPLKRMEHTRTDWIYK